MNSEEYSTVMHYTIICEILNKCRFQRNSSKNNYLWCKTKQPLQSVERDEVTSQRT